MFGKRYASLLEKVADLSMALANLQARVTKLEYDLAAAEAEKQTAEESAEAQRERLINEGLAAILNFDGKVGAQ